MIERIKLESNHIYLKKHFITYLILTIVILILTYFVAGVAQIEQKHELMNYENILHFSCTITIILFGVVSIIMYSSLFIQDRLKTETSIMTILIILSFTFLSTVIGIGIPTTIFLLTESMLPIVHDTLTHSLFTEIMRMILFTGFSVISIESIVIGIGVVKKSIPVMLISTVILSCFYGNMAIRTCNNYLESAYIIGGSLIVMVIMFILLSKKRKLYGGK